MGLLARTFVTGRPIRDTIEVTRPSTLVRFTRGRRSLTLAAAAALALLVGGCRSATTAPAAAVSSDTWATVDGREIKRDDVDKAYRRVGQGAPNASEEEVLAAKLTLLNDLIVRDILQAKAAALKIELTDTELDTAFADARKGIPDDAFQQELTRRNLTAADMRDGLRREMLAQKVIEREVVVEGVDCRAGNRRFLCRQPRPVQLSRGVVPHRADRVTTDRGAASR